MSMSSFLSAHLNNKLIVGDDHLPRAEGPVVDRLGPRLCGAGQSSLSVPWSAHQLDLGLDLRLDWASGLY